MKPELPPQMVEELQKMVAKSAIYLAAPPRKVKVKPPQKLPSNLTEFLSMRVW